ncbi:hypothetical protein [Clostridium sp. B9]|uniref:hypothetical protein n=1 Tax=Clostridium sp. B9 TaxID=3423224 RepID=UPI003D2F2554
MSKNSNWIELRDTLRKGANIVDELLELEKREEAGENVEEECEALMGRFMFVFIKLNGIAEKL